MEIRLRIHGLNGKILDEISRLTGREVRAKVLTGAPTGELATLRMAGYTIKARVDGRPLSKGEDLFLFVERLSPANFRLIVLEKTSQAGVSSSDIGRLPSGLPPDLMALYAEFVELSKDFFLVERKKPQENIIKQSYKKINISKEEKEDILEAIPEKMKPAVHELITAGYIHSAIHMEWRETEKITGFLMEKEMMHVFFLRLETSSLKMSILLSSQSKNFEDVTVVITPDSFHPGQHFLDTMKENIVREGIVVRALTVWPGRGFDVSA